MKKTTLGETTSRTVSDRPSHKVYSRRSDRFVWAVLRSSSASRAVAQSFQRAARFIASRVTAAGWFMFAVAIAGVLLGAVLGWYEALVLGLAAVVLMLLAIPFLFGKGLYSVTLTVMKERVVAGETLPAQLEVVNAGKRLAMPSRMDIPVGQGILDVQVPFLRAGQQLRQSLQIPAMRRGVIRVGPVTMVKTDPLRLFSNELTWSGATEVYVHPATVALPGTSTGFIRDLEGNPTRRIVSSDLAFHAIREYAPGDSQRIIHWKSTAKTGKLMVRQFEETRKSKMMILLSVNPEDYADGEEFELAISAAGSLAVRSIRDGRDVEFITSAQVPELVRMSVASLRKLRVRKPNPLLDELAALEFISSTARLEEIAALTARTETGLALAVLVCGSSVELRTLQRISKQFSSEISVLGLIADQTKESGVQTAGTLSVLNFGVLEDFKQLVTRGVKSS